MSIWHILDTSPTRDESEIRRAYARQLKKHRPESDPQGYQQLREAFEAAKKLVLAGETHADTTDGEINIGIRIPFTSQRDAETVHLHPEVCDPVTLYNADSINALAQQLVCDELAGLRALNLLWEKVSCEGSLPQQHLFHHHLARALSKVPGLTEDLVERIAQRLGWGMDEYKDSHVIPFLVRDALNKRIRQTTIERVLAQMTADENQGALLNKMAIRLLKSERDRAPLWVHLIPGLLKTINQYVKSAVIHYPELASQFNPAMLRYFSQIRLGLSWQGIFLALFWGIALSPAWKINPTAGVLAVTLVIFYLYVSDILLMGLRSRPGWFDGFLITESVGSLSVILLFFIWLFFAVLSFISPSGLRSTLIASSVIMLVLAAIFYWAWPRGAPFLRRPGMAMSRILSSPWKMLECMDFAWFSVICAVLYLIICEMGVVMLLQSLG